MQNIATKIAKISEEVRWVSNTDIATKTKYYNKLRTLLPEVSSLSRSSKCQFVYSWVYCAEDRVMPPVEIRKVFKDLELNDWYKAFPIDTLSRFSQVLDIAETQRMITERQHRNWVFDFKQHQPKNLSAFYTWIIDVLMCRTVFIAGFGVTPDVDKLDKFLDNLYNLYLSKYWKDANISRTISGSFRQSLSSYIGDILYDNILSSEGYKSTSGIIKCYLFSYMLRKPKDRFHITKYSSSIELRYILSSDNQEVLKDILDQIRDTDLVYLLRFLTASTTVLPHSSYITDKDIVNFTNFIWRYYDKRYITT